MSVALPFSFASYLSVTCFCAALGGHAALLNQQMNGPDDQIQGFFFCNVIESRETYVLKCLESPVDDEDNIPTQVLDEVEAATPPVVPKPSIFSQPPPIRQVPSSLMNDDDASEAGKNHPK